MKPYIHEKNTTTYQMTANLILRYIISEKLDLGDPLPTFRKLSEIFEVSYVTITKAMAHLSKEGYVKAHQGRGSLVSMPYADVEKKLRDLNLSNEGKYPEKVILPRNLLTRLQEQPTQSKQGALPIRIFAFTTFTQLMQDAIANTIIQYLEEYCSKNLQPLLFHCFKVNQKLYFPPKDMLKQQAEANICIRPFNHNFLLELCCICPNLISIDYDATPFGIPSLVTNNLEAAHYATSQLLLKGHRQIAFIKPSLPQNPQLEEDPAIADRLMGFRLACQAYDLTEDKSPIYDWQNFSALDTMPHTTGLIAYDETMAEKIIRIAKEKKMENINEQSVIVAGAIQTPPLLPGCYFEPTKIIETFKKLRQQLPSANQQKKNTIPFQFFGKELIRNFATQN